MIKGKCNAIKERNSFILVSMLNLRQKMMHHLYEQKVRVQSREAEMERVVNKIK